MLVRRIVTPLVFALLLFALLLFATGASWAQSTNATVNGRVEDPSGAAISGAKIDAININTNVSYGTETNGVGFYSVNVPPGEYRILVSKDGFAQVVKPDVELHVQDDAGINFAMRVGSTTESVVVEGGAPLVNTQDASVSTVVDRQFVGNLPLNGRSFQSLILLTPGVLTNNPQTFARSGDFGEFSVNGQRSQSNVYTVDGVSVNFAAPAGSTLSAGNSGSLPAFTVLGTTQGLVSIDALEEFRVQSSTYSAEFGRSPGGQFSFVTRSGTNQLHGDAFDYFRNDIFDATDWFNGHLGVGKAPLRQNDFGGTLGGPITIPGIYQGRDRTFFFVSYEGLRLVQPQPATTSIVPSAALRASAPPDILPALTAFPLPSCPAGSGGNCTTDFGDGLGQFAGSWSNPSSIESFSIRLDNSIGQNTKVFFRLGLTNSEQNLRTGGDFADPAVLQSLSADTRTYTVGLNNTLSRRVNNDLRFNYSTAKSIALQQVTDFEGAKAVDLGSIHGINVPDYAVVVFMPFSNFAHNASLVAGQVEGTQQQLNVTDNLSIAVGAHQLKFGIDYRRLNPVQKLGSPNIFYEYLNAEAVNNDASDFASAQATDEPRPHFTNFSAYAQDEWKASPRLTVSSGVRWEVNPAPAADSGNMPYTVEGDLSSPAGLTVAPRGTKLWSTSWFNFAPRLGMAYLLRNSPGTESVLRGGAGVFFDTGQQKGTFGYNGAGFSATNFYFSAPFPLASNQLSPEIVNPPVGPGLLIYGFAPHLQLPFTWQWNMSFQQGLGPNQALTVSYVGANGRRLLKTQQLNLTGINPDIGTLIFTSSGLGSNYDALQTQFQRKWNHGLQGIAAYTWSHSIDYGSQDTSLAYIRGNSDFDVRHNFSGALSYELQHKFQNRLAEVLIAHWAFEDRFSARTGFPVLLTGPRRVNTETSQSYDAGLDLVAGQSLYEYGAQFPGGRRINPAAFALPPSGQAGNAPRNFLRGFGAWQMDLAMKREFALHDTLKLQFRAEAFNVFNHPIFGAINTSLCSASDPLCTFGQATSTLARSLGGLNSLYQVGGPRSMQFAMKLVF